MMTERKFYRAIISVPVLSEKPIPSGLSLEQLGWMITEGDWCGGSVEYKLTVLNGKEAADALSEYGSDPGFFMLNDQGEDVES